MTRLILLVCLLYAMPIHAQDIEAINQQAINLYVQTTGSDAHHPSEFYTDWTDYEQRIHALLPGVDANCCQAIYIPDLRHAVIYAPQADNDLMRVIIHEQIHADVIGVAETNRLNTQAWGFELIVNGEWGHLKQFDESFTDTLAMLIMRNTGHDVAIHENRLYAGNINLERFLRWSMEAHGLTLADWWRLHTTSDVTVLYAMLGEYVAGDGYEFAVLLESWMQ